MNKTTALDTIPFSRRLTIGTPSANNTLFWRHLRTFALLIFAPCIALLWSSAASAQSVRVAGQLLIDVNATRGLTTNTALDAGETNVTAWANHGTLGGEFDAASNSVYAITGINPPEMTNYAGVLAPSSPNGRMMVANFNTPTNLQGHVPYTVECWFYEVSFSASPDGVFGWTLSAPPSGDAGIFSAANIAEDAADGNNLNWTPSGAAPTFGAWHYGVVTYDGTTEKAYLDGSLSNSAALNLNFVAVNASATVGNPSLFSYLLAIPATSSSSRFNGAIASLRVHTEALSGPDVASNYLAGISAVPVSPTNSITLDSSPVTSILGTSATLNGILTASASPSTTTLMFFYDTKDDGDATNAWPHSVTVSGPVSLGAFSANTSGLTIGTTYYTRIYAVNSGATNMSSFVTTFTTQGKPIVNNGGAFFVMPGSDNLTANLVNDGTAGAGASLTLYYGPTDGGTVPGSWANSVALGTLNNGVQSGTVSGLTTLSNYYFTYSAQNTYGTTFASPSRAFQEGSIFYLNTTNLPAASLPPAALTPITNWQSSSGAFSAGAGASVHDLGGVQFADFSGTQNLYVPTNTFPNGAPSTMPINGASLVVALEPTGVNGEAGNTGGTIITTVYDEQFGIGFGGGINVPIFGGSVIGVTITSGGSGYTNSSGVPVPPAVTFSAPGGMSANTTATGTAVVSAAGVVTGVVITYGGSGYAWQRTAQVLNVPLPTVTFAPGVTTATGTAVMGTNNNGFQIETVVNTSRPSDTTAAGDPEDGYNWASTVYGRPLGNDVYLPENQVSVVSVVAGSGLNGVGQPTATGPNDNNYLVYVNGVLVEDTASGFVSSLTLTTTNGAGYLPHGGHIPLTFNTPPGGTPATGYMTVSSSTSIPGHINGVVLTSGGSGYTAANPPVISVPAPTDPSNPQTNAVITFTDQSVGNYLPEDDGGGSGLDGAPSVGFNGEGMGELEYNLGAGTYGSGNANSTFGIGDQAGTGEIGYIGYMGDVYVYGESLTTAQRQALENAEGAKFITGATESFALTSSVTPSAGGTISGPASGVQGYNATYTITLNPGYALSGVTDNGVSVGTSTSYTVTNVSATHNIVATVIAVPEQLITVTYGAGGSVSTNGTTIASGSSLNVSGGLSLAFTLTANPGSAMTSLTVDGKAQPLTGTYTYQNLGVPLSGGTNHTIAVTFGSLPTSPVSSFVPESQSLFFSVDTTSLPQTSGTPIVNWPMYYSSQGSNTMYNGIGVYEATTTPTTNTPANTYLDANGVIWEQNLVSANNFYQFYYGFAGPAEFSAVTWEGTAPNTIIPNTGATIMAVVSPIGGNTESQGWNSVVNVFFGCLELSVLPSGLIQGIVDNNQAAYDGTGSTIATSTYAIPNGTNVVLSLVAQTNGSFMVYANTQLVISNAGIAPHSLYLQSDYQSYTFNNNIYIGSDGPDGASDFNGLIGNTYFWTTALTTPERTNLEAALMTQFHAVVPPNYNWIGANNANFSSVTSWSNTVPLGFNSVPTPTANPFFSFPGAGQTVNLDMPETLAGLTFATNNTTISSAAQNSLTLSSATANSVITLTNGGSATLDVPVYANAGLNVVGNGSLTITNGIALGSSATSLLHIASGTSNNVTFTQTGGTLSTFNVAQSWTAAAVGPGVMLGGAGNTGITAVYNLNGGTLAIPNIGCVTDSGAVLVAPSTYGATAILNLNGGTLQATESDSTDDARSQTEGSAHLIFNTTHTWINAGGAIINTGGNDTSIAVPLEHYPSGPDIDGGFTLLGGGYLTNMSYATYTGPTKVAAGTLVCMLTNSIGGNTLDIDDGGVLSLNFTGTLDVYQLTINAGAPMAVGTYGATGSGATHIDNTHFAGTGTVTVLGNVTTPEKPNFTGTVFSGSVAGGTGSIVLSGTGGIPGGTYEVLGSTNVATPLSNWVTIATGTFTSSGFSTTIPVTTNVPQQFIKVVVP